MKINIRHYLLKDWEEEITGVVLAENQDWILLHEIVSDYALDGYVLANKSQIEDHYKNEQSDLQELVLNLRNYLPTLPAHFKMGTVEEMLKQINKQHIIFGVHEEEEIISIGTIQSIVANELRLHYISPTGYEDPSIVTPIFMTSIHTITFDNDYINAVKLLAKYRAAEQN
ncbi:MAG: hypothetical protein AAF242_14680 [Bacteroidota bacterium]